MKICSPLQSGGTVYKKMILLILMINIFRSTPKSQTNIRKPIKKRYQKIFPSIEFDSN